MTLFAVSDTILTTIPAGPWSGFITSFFVIFNNLLCLSIVFRLIAFERNGARHRISGGALAILMMVFYMWPPIQLIFGRTAIVDWATIGINCIVFIAIFRARGNVMQLFKS